MMRKIKNHHHAFRGDPEKLTATLNEILTSRERVEVDNILIGESTPSGMHEKFSRSQQEGEIVADYKSLEQRRDNFQNLK